MEVGMSATASGLDYYRRIFDRPLRGLDRSSLPSQLASLKARGTSISRPRGEWILLSCPAHKNGNERHPSLSMSLVDGHFRCHACGAKGGDIVALHMLTTGLRFR